VVGSEPTTCTTDGIDGIRVIGEEECDDGNNSPGDGCESNLIIPYWVCSEDVNLKSTCFYNPCGNSIVDSTNYVINEECDDSNLNLNDGCNICIVEIGWQCPSNICTPI